MGLYRILRYCNQFEDPIFRHCFDKHQVDQYDILIDSLPGFPDNIRLMPNGLISIPIPMLRLPAEAFMNKYLRSLIAKVATLTGNGSKVLIFLKRHFTAILSKFIERFFLDHGQYE